MLNNPPLLKDILSLLYKYANIFAIGFEKTHPIIAHNGPSGGGPIPARVPIPAHPRRGYLGSTLLACRAMALPHIKLEICIKSFSVE